MAKCKYCSTEIEWTKEGDRYIPYNTDGTVHRCRKQESKQSDLDSKKRYKITWISTRSKRINFQEIGGMERCFGGTISNELAAELEKNPLSLPCECMIVHSPSNIITNLIPIDGENSSDETPKPEPGPQESQPVQKSVDNQEPQESHESQESQAPEEIDVRKSRKIVLCGTINLDNFENLRIEISGEVATPDERDQLIEDWRELLLLFGKRDEFTHVCIDKYVRRVLP